MRQIVSQHGLILDVSAAPRKHPAKPKPAANQQADERGGVFPRAFAMLEFIVRRAAPVSPIEIAEGLDLPKPTAYRLIDNFERQGFLQRQFGSKRVTVGPRLTDLAFDILRASVQYAPRRMILESIVREVGETCNIGALEANEIVYLDRVEAKHWPLRLQFGIGSRVPLHCTAIGKLFLAFLPDSQRKSLLDNIDLESLTPATITDFARLGDELAAIRRDGLSIDREEYLLGVVCCAAPIFNRNGDIRAGVAIQAPAARLAAAEIGRHRARLIQAAEQLSGSFDFE